jgi:hypothetical protein
MNITVFFNNVGEGNVIGTDSECYSVCSECAGRAKKRRNFTEYYCV